jgi:hypothetical protein
VIDREVVIDRARHLIALSRRMRLDPSTEPRPELFLLAYQAVLLEEIWEWLSVHGQGR